MSSLVYGAVHIGLMALFYGLMYFIFIRHIVKLNKSAIKNLYVWGVSFLTVMITNLLSQWMAHVGNDIYHNLYDSLLCILLLISQYGLLAISEMTAKNRDMKLILHLNEEQHKMYKENIDFVNRKCHDIKHQIIAIRAQRDNCFAEDSLKQIEESIIIYDSILKTGNPALDVILTEKKFICEKYGIRFSAIVEGESLDFIEEEDIYVLFGNALDNAIESVMEIEDETERIITIRLMAKGELLSLHFDNACQRDIKFKNGLPLTTKENERYHGYGMRSIKYIVEKYGGNVEVVLKDGLFNLNIIIPINQRKNIG